MSELYEIMNPSDAYTCTAESDTVVTIAMLMLGRGLIGAKRDGCEEAFGLLMFCPDIDAWWAEHFPGEAPLREFHAGWVAQVADCLDSVLIGSKRHRVLYEETLAMLPEERHADFRAMWHDKHRDSMNDIGARAWALAEGLRRRLREEAAAVEGDDNG
jgi:hypothetical protein